MKLHNDYRRMTVLEEHHCIYGWGKRSLSEKYGLKVYLCPPHHRSSTESVHDNTQYNKQYGEMIKADAQQAFEKAFPNMDFREIFGKSYLKKSENLKKTEWESNFPPGFTELTE